MSIVMVSDIMRAIFLRTVPLAAFIPHLVWAQSISTYEVTNGDTAYFTVSAVPSDTSLALNQLGENGLPQGEWYHRFPDGTYKCSGSYKDGRKDGPWEKRFTNGALRYCIQLREGYLDGPAEFYYPNGVLRETGSFRRGLQHGVFTTYDPAGRLARVERFRAGFSHGPTMLYMDGLLVGSGATGRDKRRGTWRFKYDEATLIVKYRHGWMISNMVER